jgi:hypothetical protein
MEFRDYLTFLEEIRQELEALTKVEQQKIQAVRAGDLDALDSCMKQEQAATLTLRGKEQHRQAMLKELGLEQVSVRELPQHCPPQLQGETARVTEQVLRAYQVLSSTQKAALTMMQTQLHQIDALLEQHTPRAEEKKTAAPKTSGTDFRA